MSTQAVVVLTGPCKLTNGLVIPREALAKAMTAAGMRMTPSYRDDCSYVVASRIDTVKAYKAQQQGKTVLTYDQFVKHLADLGIDATDPAYRDGVKENPIVDQMPTKLEWTPTDATGAVVL